MPPTFYEIIKQKAEYPKSLAPPSFADYCEHIDDG